MIKQVLEGSVCFEYNQDRALFANKMIDKFKKETVVRAEIIM